MLKIVKALAVIAVFQTAGTLAGLASDANIEGIKAFRAGEYEKAEKCYRQALEEDQTKTGQASIYRNLALLYKAQNKDAQEFTKKADELDPPPLPAPTAETNKGPGAVKKPAAALPSAAAKKTGSSTSPLMQKLAEISQRGKALFEYDYYCALATEALLAKCKPDRGNADMYLGEKKDSTWTFAFGKLESDGNSFSIYYKITLGPGKPPAVEILASPQSDKASFFTRAKAIRTCVPQAPNTGYPMNYAILPEGSDKYLVYIYPSSGQPNVYLLGGDVRFSVSAATGKILETRQMHKTLFPYPRPGDSSGATTGAGALHNTLSDDVPEDTDVSHVLKRRPQVPEFVGTKNWVFQINNDGSIQLHSMAQK